MGLQSIPHVFNATDKLFFFFAWEQLKRTIGGTQVSTVPTNAERGGTLRISTIRRSRRLQEARPSIPAMASLFIPVKYSILPHNGL